ncbi:hypothetical protein [Niabella hibiscisoli]|uniref:hypothetical protein n=1 Tax=Niabella hibiscisoli TaxID=1825928 RepID=UPI00293F4B06|nr:hypothetical protein [Niabella hibiscisoli]
MTVVPTQDAYDYVLKNVGAILPVRDAVDKRIVETVKTGKVYNAPDAQAYRGRFIKRRLPDDSYKQGIITHPSQVGGYPVYKGSPYTDSDNDGIPDDYEKKNKLNPKDGGDAKLIAKNGYSNIENYLNSLVDIATVKPAKGISKY